MCSFYLQRHGDKNAVTQERYIELYAEGSPYKNREFREAAEENYDGLVKELNKSAEDFKALVRERRPQVTEEQLMGDTYEAREVMGTLIDGQKTFDECVERLLEISGYGVADENENENFEDRKQVIENNNNNQKTEDMSLEYPRIMAASKAEALESVDEAVYLHKDLAEELEAHLAAAEETAAALDNKTAEVVALTEKISQMEAAQAEINEKLSQMETAHAEAIEKLNQEHTATLDTLKSEHETALQDAADKAAAEMEQMKSEHASAVAELNDKLAEAAATIDAKEAEIVELAGKPATQDKGEAPADNNSGASAQVRESLTAVRPGMTTAERRAALRQMEERLRRTV